MPVARPVDDLLDFDTIDTAKHGNIESPGNFRHEIPVSEALVRLLGGAPVNHHRHLRCVLRGIGRLGGIASVDLNRDRSFLYGVLSVLERPIDPADRASDETISETAARPAV